MLVKFILRRRFCGYVESLLLELIHFKLTQLEVLKVSPKILQTKNI